MTVATEIAAGLRQKIRAFANLPKGWDTYEAEPPTEESRSVAERIVTSLAAHHLRVRSITPTSDNSILLKHEAGSAMITWEVDGDGEMGVMVERRDRKTEFFSVKFDELDGFIAKIARHG